MRFKLPPLPYKKVAIGAAALAVAATLAFLLLPRGGRHPTRPGPSPSRTPAEPLLADFRAGDVRAVDARDRPEAADRAKEEARKILAFLNDYYNIAFIDTRRWRAGGHPELPGLFGGEARGSVAGNLGALALADLTPKIKSVRPTRQEASRITVLIEDDLSAPYALVSAVLEGTAKAKAPEDGPVRILHSSTFLLAKEGEVYMVAAYAVQMNADTLSREAVFRRPQDLEAAWRS